MNEVIGSHVYKSHHLRATPAAVRFVSFEPLIGRVEADLRGIDWAIIGGESGPRCRDNGFEDNARAIQAQCAAAGVAFFGKQNVGKRELPADLMVREFPA